ncbi:hypothetical protein WMY93_006225 [Mugilogobius chulae]|uniref:Endonuclease/exonuclease/phosphatase domain-containing protein n=1 Tax=Mugilogobius chulae TaxID=88201 RepID=A0AAW0PK79_9GOBI
MIRVVHDKPAPQIVRLKPMDIRVECDVPVLRPTYLTPNSPKQNFCSSLANPTPISDKLTLLSSRHQPSKEPSPRRDKPYPLSSRSNSDKKTLHIFLEERSPRRGHTYPLLKEVKNASTQTNEVKNASTQTNDSKSSKSSQNESSDDYVDFSKPTLYRCSSDSDSSENTSAPGPPDPPRDYESSESETESESSSESSSGSESGCEEVELNMAVLNARSVNKLVRTGSNAITNLIQGNNLDVLLISETWLPQDSRNNSEFVNILPPNYSVFNEPRFYGRGGGVAIVFSDAFECYEISFNFTLRFEYVAACLSLPCALNSILILNVYRRPAQTIPDFLRELATLLSMIDSEFSTIIIGGDFNIWVDCPNRRATQAFQNLLDENNLVQRVREPTHRRGHILDLVIARNNVRISGLSVQPNSFSDHSTVSSPCTTHPKAPSDL